MSDVSVLLLFNKVKIISGLSKLLLLNLSKKKMILNCLLTALNIDMTFIFFSRILGPMCVITSLACKKVGLNIVF